MNTAIRDIIENNGYDERLPDYESLVKTDTGKDKFWELVKTSKGSLSDEIYRALVDLVNITYTSKEV